MSITKPCAPWHCKTHDILVMTETCVYCENERLREENNDLHNRIRRAGLALEPPETTR